MNLLSNFFGGSYEDLWKAVIQPNRDIYKDEDLGPEKFQIKNKFYKRTDFTITNKRNYKLMCSFWEPYDEEREYTRLPCVVYLHGNSSSRCEAIAEIKYLLPLNITVFSFDFSGCGRSEGEYISLGWYEKDDVECVINYLRKTNKVSTIGLWGRSMGAVTAIMYGDRDPSIAGLILDSPFASLRELIEELVKERVNLPNFILNQAIKLVKSTILKKAKFNLDNIEPKTYAVRCFIPALFCHGKNDTFVNVHHCKDLAEVYAGDKNVIYVEGNHNSPRPRFFRDSAAIFFYNTLQCERIKQISDDYNGFKQVLNENINNDVNDKNDNNNNVNDFNNDNNNNMLSSENEELMFQKMLELSLKEYEESEKKKKMNNDNKNDNQNQKNDNNFNNINNINVANHVLDDNIIDNNLNDNNINDNNIIDNNIIDNNINNNSHSNNIHIVGDSIPNDNVTTNSQKGLFEDLNPVPLQNHFNVVDDLNENPENHNFQFH